MLLLASAIYRRQWVSADCVVSSRILFSSLSLSRRSPSHFSSWAWILFVWWVLHTGRSSTWVIHMSIGTLKDFISLLHASLKRSFGLPTGLFLQRRFLHIEALKKFYRRPSGEHDLAKLSCSHPLASLEKKRTLFPIIISAYYIQELSLCGNLCGNRIIWLVYERNFPHE